MDTPIAPGRVLPCQAQYQLADGADGARPARALGPGSGRVMAGQEIPVPAQHRVGPHQQPEPAEHVAWDPVQQGGQERPVGGGEPRPDRAQLPFQHRDLVAQRQDLRIFVPVAHRKKPQ